MPTLAIVGPGSLLGRELLVELEVRPAFDRLLLLSEKAGGTELPFRGSDQLVEELDGEAIAARPETVIFTPGAARARRWVKSFADAGARVIDLSSAHRHDPQVPLVGLGPTPPARLLSLPGAAALSAARLVGELLRAAPGPRLTATLLVPVSSIGQRGVRELARQTAALLGGRSQRPRTFPHRVAFNLLPEVGATSAAPPSQDTVLEAGFRAELRRLVSLPQLPVEVTAVRVPVFYGLSLVLSGSTGTIGEAPGAASALAQAWAGQTSWVKVLSEPGTYPMPSLSLGDSAILAGRLRGEGDGFALYATVDPLRILARAAVEAALDSR